MHAVRTVQRRRHGPDGEQSHTYAFHESFHEERIGLAYAPNPFFLCAVVLSVGCNVPSPFRRSKHVDRSAKKHGRDLPVGVSSRTAAYASEEEQESRVFGGEGFEYVGVVGDVADRKRADVGGHGGQAVGTALQSDALTVDGTVLF